MTVFKDSLTVISVTGLSPTVFPAPSNVFDLWVFGVLACGALVAAIVAITRRTALGAALAMVVCALFGAGLFAALSAPFLAVAFVLLHAGGLLAFFVFGVIMLNRDDAEPVALRSIVVRLGACVAAWMVLVFAVGHLRFDARLMGIGGALDEGFGSTAVMGKAMYADLLLPTVLVAVLLAVCLVSALALSRVITVVPRKD